MKPAVRALLALQLVLVSTAAAEQFAVYQSTDRGRSWSRAGQGLPAHSRINAFASLDNMIFAGTNAGVFLSRDAGRTWLPTVVSDRIVALATLGASLYAATASAGILLSTDRGATWASSLNFPVARVRSLLGAGGQLYAGTDSGAVLVSRNAGPTWSGAQPTWRSLEPGLPAPRGGGVRAAEIGGPSTNPRASRTSEM